MRNIGFHGGHTIYELGPLPDIVLFFECLQKYVQETHPERDWSLLTDRLYRRYLRLNELSDAFVLMELAKSIFATRPASAVDWITHDPIKTWLDPNQPTLADVFSRYFEHFINAKNSAESFLEAFNIYQPVKTVIADLPGFTVDKRRPLTEYDTLEGKPFWLQ